VWIRIGFNADPDPALYLNADLDPDPGRKTSAVRDPGQKTCQQGYKKPFLKNSEPGIFDNFSQFPSSLI
jgi:hypothetical protein